MTEPTDKPLPPMDVMRTLLANERTFLAWCRTSLGLVTFGFLLEKLIWYLKREAGIESGRTLHELGAMSLFSFALGGLTLLASSVRFFSLQKQLGAGYRRFSFWPEALLTGAVALLLALCLFSSSDLLR